MSVNKADIWELVIQALPGNPDDRKSYPFFMVVEDVFDIRRDDFDKVLTGKVLTGEVHKGDTILVGGCSETVVGLKMFRQILDRAEEGDNVGVLLASSEYNHYSVIPGASVCIYSMNNMPRVDWDKLISGIKEHYGCHIIKKELTRECNNVGRLVDKIASLIKERGSSFSSSVATSEKPTANNHEYKSNIIMAIDKNKIEYVIGIDLGHGETSAAICPMQWDKLDDQLDSAKDLEMEPNRKVIPSAITITADGTAKIGTAAFDPNILKKANVHVCFKRKPENIDGESEKLMIRFMQEVYRKIRENNGGMLTDTNHLVWIATPSGWDAKNQELYLEMAKKAGIPMGGVTRESRAAFVRAQHDPTANLGRNIEKGAIVFDMGSSTLDFTYHNSNLVKMIDNGYDCGASAVEKAMFAAIESSNDAIKEFRSKYPDLVDYLLFEVRRAKEEIYFDTTRKYKKTINFEDFIDDEDLEDERFRLKYEAGELNDFLEKTGYIQSIREAMEDFIDNYIPAHNIFGVFLTGGASRMDFIKKLVTECWGVAEDKVFRDQDPSLTISEGVAEVARVDLRTGDITNDLEPLFRKINGNDIYNSFVELFGNYMVKSIADVLEQTIISWRDDTSDLSLNLLNNRIKNNVRTVVHECSKRVNEGIDIAIKENTKELTEKVDALVKAYTTQGANISLPSLTDMDVRSAGTGVDMSQVIQDLSSSIETESSNWGGLVAGAGIGAAVAMIFGGPLAWIIGGGALLGKWLFGESETEEQKKQKAMSKNLTSDERCAVSTKLGEKWEEIITSVNKSVFDSLSNNVKARKNVANAIDRLMSAYKDVIAKSRILVD